MKKGSRRCQYRRIGGYENCKREASAGAVLWSDTKGGALLCPEHFEKATEILIKNRMSMTDCVMWALKKGAW